MKPLYTTLLLGGLGLAVWLASHRSAPDVSVVSGGSVPSPAAIEAGSPMAAGAPAGPVLDVQKLKTFRGASVDGALRTSLAGELIIDTELRRWIDFYLSAQGEVALAELVAAMQAGMAQLPQPGQDQALGLLEDYLGYLAALGDYDYEAQKRLAGGSLDEMTARLEWQQRLRRQWLQPAVVEAFFHDDEVLDNYALARLSLLRQGASADQFQALEQALPEALQAQRQQSRQILTLHQQEQSMKDAGAGDDDINAWRTQQYGAEAAGRLADADKRQQAWQQRVIAYRDFAGSLALKELADADREQLLDSYRQRNFSAAEIKRLPAALSLLAAE